MRKFVFQSLLAATLAVSVSTTVGCNKGDPNALETQVKKLDEEESRSEGFQQLERIVSGIVTNPEDPRRQEFAEKVLPKFEEIWDSAEPYREQMLTMALQIERPEAAGIWKKAIIVDGSAEAHKQAIIAFQGIRAANATELGGPIAEQFKALNESPGKDMGAGQEGALRYEMAKTLGELKASEGVDVLIETLEIPEETMGEAKPVYKAAIDALGQIGDPKAVDALITVQFAVADAPGTQSIGERGVRALGAIGEPAVPKLLETVEGKNEKVNKLAVEKGADVTSVQATAVRTLGVIGSKTAAEAVIAYMPQRDCGEEPEEIEDEDELGQMALLRQVAANALGQMRAESAVPALCSCRDATHDPGDTWVVVSALGRIASPEAFECLETVVSEGYYDPEIMGASDLKYTLRWEAARWMIIAAAPDNVADVKAVIEGNDPKVKEEVEKLGWMKGLAVVEECKDDKDCYGKVLADTTRDWFEREVAAFNFARRSEPGDTEAAVQLAKAFKTRDPSARVNIAWLTASVAGDEPCPECAAELEKVMKSEELTKDRLMQGAWLTARQSIAKVGGGSED
ncbi:HEAT repeat domain-containing protein [Pseudenhygromyxa sp. WMMC2535]|uniref:HEAT repeat domain-containing protein n=1 Tax=Pseudenhygromyxa sp. WMMC2535 TaxID=2712867 RepID=UPI00155467FA|nr:HEAT repeat domain-containing protein [Pseudenhygromyxa sp. WMMC2535]NVB36839.1 HEAT repeat domain-containing protein [Pseudenhygromyxa sp. WMMC2535]